MKKNIPMEAHSDVESEIITCDTIDSYVLFRIRRNVESIISKT